MIPLALLMAFAEPPPIVVTTVPSETFIIDWPSLDAWDCTKLGGGDRIETFYSGSLRLVRTTNGEPPKVLFDCVPHQSGGSIRSVWMSNGICAVEWDVALNLDDKNPTEAVLNVNVNGAKLHDYRCIKSVSGERG